ncbi:MAG: hypothetical protein JJD92_01390 [Frankiaceae bacterium]|nr:hypothetical protein [Frankiaceae bacterium]
MLDKLLSVTVQNAKLALAAVAGAALVAGGSAVAITQVSDSGPVKGGENLSVTGAENRSDTATATITPKSPKPSKSPKAEADADSEGGQGVHGACVSAVAHDKSLEGREHGKAVSAAAHSCPKGGDEADATEAAEADEDADEDADEAEAPRAPKPEKSKGNRGKSDQDD